MAFFMIDSNVYVITLDDCIIKKETVNRNSKTIQRTYNNGMV
jgi:hypothetical protein